MSNPSTENTNNVELKLDLILAKITNLETRLKNLEATVDDRLKDTRPLWQVIISRFEGIETRLDSIDNKLGCVEKELRSINNRLSAFADEPGIEILHKDEAAPKPPGS